MSNPETTKPFPAFLGGRWGQFSAEERASMFIEWCSLQNIPGWRGLPLGAYDQLVAHIRQGERPFPLKD